jgi:acetolactate decarboxylase
MGGSEQDVQRRVMRASVVIGTLLWVCALYAQVTPTGAMRQTMWEGQMAGLIAMDSIAGPGMFGIGPLEHLRGEITLVDGRCYVSSVASDGTISVQERNDVKAPFFVRAEVRRWTPVALPAKVVDLATLDAFLTEWDSSGTVPFAFRLRGLVGDVHVHVMNVPAGTTINGPDEAHAHQVLVRDTGNEGTLVGFFSTKHKAVFTHHDTNIHMHYISWDHSVMGHVDLLQIDASRIVLEVGR